MGSGIAAGLAFGIASAWALQLQPADDFPAGPVAVGMVPLISIGLTPFVLAGLEPNRYLLVFTIAYTVVALLVCGLGGRRPGLGGGGIDPLWSFLPGLVVTGCLLAHR
ncbi:hypothetical protein [Nocardia carnea]|uniref:hypothetical protein n=1 Tax=Nocardia carnea TaxID=37328 RepID=UPI002458F2FC|nr:hypothetical protein [Nocardia carnea]